MRITFEKHGNSAFIYVYLREFDGTIVNTITNVSANLLFDNSNNWIGIEIFNNICEGSKIQLPNLKHPYIKTGNEGFTQTEEKICILFDSVEIYKNHAIACNVDFNGVNGLQGIEIIVSNFNCNLNIASNFMNRAM